MVSLEEAERETAPVVGYLAYDYVVGLEPTVPLPQDGPIHPESRFIVADQLVRFDHVAGIAEVVSGDPETLSLGGWPGDSVRLATGEGAGRTGRLVGLAGPTRRPGGVYQPAGHVELGPTADSAASRRVLPLADLERLVPELDA